MKFFESFMDEIEKIAVVGTPLGRMVTYPSIRGRLAENIREARKILSPAKVRVMLAGVRGGLEVVPPHLRHKVGLRHYPDPSVHGPLKTKIMEAGKARVREQGAREIKKGRMTQGHLREVLDPMDVA